MWECPECSEENDLDPDVEDGQIVECLECGTEFEILSVKSLLLEPLAVEDSESDDDADDWDD